MQIKKSTILIPLLALVLAGCAPTPSKKKRRSSSEEPTSVEPTSGVDPTSSTPTSSTATTSTYTTSSTPAPTSTTPTPTSSTPAPTTASSSSSAPTPSSSSTSQVPVVVHVTGVTISGSETITKKVGDSSFTLTWTVSPSNATNKNVTWKSSNTSAATITNAGQVTIVAKGTTVLTVTTVDQSKTDSVTLTVSEDTPTPISKTKLDYTYDDYQENNAYGLDNCPLTGNPKLLIIPIWFTDSSSFISESNKTTVRNDIQTAYIGTNDETGWRSVKTFYQEESLNKLNLQATVSDWYSCGKTSEYYGEDDDLSRTTTLVDSAVTWYFKNNTSDNRRNYDTNGDGFMDGVMLIYAAADSSTDESFGANLWAYCYWLENDASTSSPAAKTFFWASYDFMYDSSNAYTKTGKSSYGTGDCSHCNVDAHTFIHEMGHVLGLEDYYDYYEGSQLCPAGGFSMQDWNMGGHDPYSVMAYGWADPYIPTATTTITLNDFQSSHDVILLANHTVNSPFDEYLLIELYTPTGLNELDSKYSYANYDHGPNKTGIRVWHIDGRLTYPTSISQSGEAKWSTSLVTDPSDKYQYGVYHAMSNSYGGDYGSELGSSYYNYNIVQLIRNDTSVNYRPEDYISNNDLFVAGDTYSMTTFGNQFYRTGKMNTNQNLGWSFTVDSLSSTSATITVTKA